MIKIIEITRCEQCPHLMETAYCFKKQKSIPRDYEGLVIPKWCPLPSKTQIGEVGVNIDNYADLED